MNSNMQCPICGSTNNIILENNSQKILKLRHPGLLFSNKELANKFNTRCLCPKCNLEFKYTELHFFCTIDRIPCYFVIFKL